jgi:hypothetical protein
MRSEVIESSAVTFELALEAQRVAATAAIRLYRLRVSSTILLAQSCLESIATYYINHSRLLT